MDGEVTFLIKGGNDMQQKDQSLRPRFEHHL